jgi:hypothetical protein
MRIERRTFDVEPLALDLQGPAHWKPSPGDGAMSHRLHYDVIRSDRLRQAVWTDPRARVVRPVILVPDLKQHQLFARIEMQREPAGQAR